MIAAINVAHAQLLSSKITLASCHGTKTPMRVESQMPYVLLTVGGKKGYFVIDHGSNSSFIDTLGFVDGVPLPGPSPNRFAWTPFYLPWSTINLFPQDYSALLGLKVRQAGMLGTDILSLRAFTLSYRDSAIYAADSLTLCPDSVLRGERLRPAWTLGTYLTDIDNIIPAFPRIPTIPVRIAGVAGIAQVDPAFDDRIERHSVNINAAYFRMLEAAGVRMQFVKSRQLSTCGTTETVKSYRLPAGERFEIIGTDNRALMTVTDAAIDVKNTPKAARQCGGIGTWSIAAAQMGASFMLDAGTVLFDPYSQRVWFGVVEP